MCMLPLAAAALCIDLLQLRQSGAPHNRYARLLFLPDTGAQRSNSAQSRCTLKHPVNCQNKKMSTPYHILLNFLNKSSLCVEPGLKLTDKWFSEAAIARNSVNTAKFRLSPAVRPCWAVKRSRWVLTDDGA